MASQQQMEKLQAGVNDWNTWRKQQPTKAINLRGAGLVGTNLRSADLRGADLRSADLFSANLRGANLRGADLRDTNLRNADLRDADLSKASLRGADLSSANLRDADLLYAKLHNVKLSYAKLSYAKLSYATLSYADLSYADLSYADLSYANLSYAKLSYANLSYANLRDTTLSSADLSYADLNNADLKDSLMVWTTLGELDLRCVKGLETVRHQGPSHLSINTIYKSEGDIPEIFVRGTGAPDTFIEYMHALARMPIQYYTCFISYSSKDQDFAERLYNDLQGKGIRCWFAKKDMKPGDFYRERIDESIRMYDKVLLILSKNSVKSAWVKDEVERTWEREGKPAEPGDPWVLFPIRLDDTVIKTTTAWARQLRFLRHIGDFTDWKDHDIYQKRFQQLLYDLKKERTQSNQ